MTVIILFSIFIIFVYVVIGIYVSYDNKKLRGLASVFEYKHNTTNAYVEYKQWKLLWGLMINSQKEVNIIIDEWNDDGFICINFQTRIFPNVSILKFFVIIIITIMTLGFVSLYTGPVLLFAHKSKININEKD